VINIVCLLNKLITRTTHLRHLGRFCNLEADYPFPHAARSSHVASVRTGIWALKCLVSLSLYDLGGCGDHAFCITIVQVSASQKNYN